MSSRQKIPIEFEAEKIYYTLFHEKIPEILKCRFAMASRLLTHQFSEQEQSLYDEVISKISDLEALEFAVRRKRKLQLLSMKISLMVFLAESLPENQAKFVNQEKDQFLNGLIAIFIGVVNTCYKFFKGLYFLRRLQTR